MRNHNKFNPFDDGINMGILLSFRSPPSDSSNIIYNPLSDFSLIYSIGRSFMRSPHSDVWELPKTGRELFYAHIYFTLGNCALPVLVIPIHPNADCAGKNVLLTIYLPPLWFIFFSNKKKNNILLAKNINQRVGNNEL